MLAKKLKDLSLKTVLTRLQIARFFPSIIRKKEKINQGDELIRDDGPEFKCKHFQTLITRWE